MILNNTENNTENNNTFIENYNIANITQYLFSTSENMFLCEKFDNKIDLNQYTLMLNCTINQYLTGGEFKQISWTVPIAWLLFIPSLLACFSYITNCIFKTHSEKKKRLNMIYRDGNAA